MSEQTRQWQALAAQRGLSLADYLREVLHTVPDQLPMIATTLGLIPIEPAHLAEHWRFDLLALPQALIHNVLPVDYQGRPCLVLGEPFTLRDRHWIQSTQSLRALPLAMSLPDAVKAQLSLAEASQRVMQPFGEDDENVRVSQAAQEISLSSIARDDNPVVRLVNSMLFDALQSRASDIHVESTPQGLVIKYRIDGVLQQMGQASGMDMAEQALSRIKVLSELDIGERRVPQDGRFKMKIQGREVDFRVSIMPSIHGEDAVLRILDKSQRGESLSLETLGLNADTITRIRVLASEPYGMLLVTGPTGSGKSTTLYAALSETNTGEKKIITIEDPVEYELPGVLQIPVNDKKGLTFARGLRSILRHDPDTILVGEIRDGETAGIAVQAALTGHLVLSSVHANSAFSVLERFTYMDVDPASFVEALNGVVAQRLVRRICPDCGVDAEPDADLARLAQLPETQLRQGHYREGKGCEACRHTGYRGRLALAEVLSVTDSIKEGLLHRSSASTLRELAREAGHVFIRDIALAHAAQGDTTLKELHRVISLY
ncbi:type II secretion system protein E [Pseudomonas fluorescens]|mgnify:FL=1|jgi:general secretion pathway protein E|uniref:Type II/IV secretion system protein n=2 Tax=Pseudomonas TaxID=286 RepID=A0A1B3DFX2_PSEFL|nr:MULTISPECIES: GspE/PulE family protein [Pseudomonas]AHC38319.1 type II secretion system protein E [Pseudomonas sp. TKP]AOE70416.1 type II secretion system protein E [Pseudomonas fluorescens]AOE76191.1 type II secretion system protein E [Pseudomonas fluorescens]MBL1310207.1 type II/IV secretion system protein [Pseudomonas sp.]MDR6577988.1 general secretion pathway protein E [Pseudomonas extremaustralis]